MQNVIQMTRLGNYGRWGNCLFQSAFLHIYATKYNLRVEATRFAGQEYLPFHFDLPTEKLPYLKERYTHNSVCDSQGIPPWGDEFVNRDFLGYAQYHTSWYAPHKALVQRMWTPTFSSEQEQRMLDALSGHTCIGIHYRAGDYITTHHNITNSFRPPRRWYTDWLDKHWHRFKNPLLVASVEEPKYLEWFKDYKPVTAAALGLSNHFVADWTLLSYCDVLLCPNSTFSLTAAMASQTLQEGWRATLPAGGFERYEPWNDIVMRQEQGKDYPHLELDRD